MKIISVSLVGRHYVCDTSQTFQCFSPGQGIHLSLIILIHRQVDQGCHIVENHILHGEKSAHSSHPPYNPHKEKFIFIFFISFFSFFSFHFISSLLHETCFTLIHKHDKNMIPYTFNNVTLILGKNVKLYGKLTF